MIDDRCKDPVKILYVTYENIDSNKGGAIHVLKIVQSLRQIGDRVGLIAASSCPFDGVYSIGSYRNKKDRNSVLWIPFLISTIKLVILITRMVSKYDVIYARDFHCGLIGCWIGRFFNKKVIVEVNGIASEEQLMWDTISRRRLSHLIELVEAMVFGMADHVVAVTPQLKKYLQNRHSLPSEKISVIGNGVDPEHFRSAADSRTNVRKLRKTLCIREKDLVVGFVGNMALWQGLNTLIEAIPLIPEGEPHIKFLLVGDGPVRSQLQRQAREIGITDRIIWTGSVAHRLVPDYIRLCNICVAPFARRRNQTTGVSPLKVFEYLACGKPVVASSIDNLDFIKKNAVGLLVEPDNPRAQGSAILKLLSNRLLREQFSRNAIKLIDVSYTWEHKAERISRLCFALSHCQEQP